MTTQAENLIGGKRHTTPTLGAAPKRVLRIVIAALALVTLMVGECWVIEQAPTLLGALEWALATDLTPLLDQNHWHIALPTVAAR